jgi:integrase
MNRALASIRLVLKHAATVLRDQNGNPWLAHVPELPRLDWNDGRKPYPIDKLQESLLMKHLNAELRILALWLINTGMRSQETLNLRWSWRREVPELGCYVFDVPGEFTKNNKDRVVVMNRVTQQILDNKPRLDLGFVFANAKGLKRDRVLTTNWKKARVKAADEYEALTGEPADWGFRNLRVHDLRHTFATRLRRSGVSLEVRKDLLSHVNSDVTTHYSAGELAELIEAVERLVSDSDLPPIKLEKRGEVLQFSYNAVSGEALKVAK